MKKYLFCIILSCLIATSVSARKTGCEGDCENGFGKWTYTDKTTYEGEWTDGFMYGKGTFTWSDGKQKTGIWKNGQLQE